MAINDLKGSIPKFVINAGASTHSGLLLNFKNKLDELKKNGLLLSQLSKYETNLLNPTCKFLIKTNRKVDKFDLNIIFYSILNYKIKFLYYSFALKLVMLYSLV